MSPEAVPSIAAEAAVDIANPLKGSRSAMLGIALPCRPACDAAGGSLAKADPRDGRTRRPNATRFAPEAAPYASMPLALQSGAPLSDQRGFGLVAETCWRRRGGLRHKWRVSCLALGLASLGPSFPGLGA